MRDEPEKSLLQDCGKGVVPAPGHEPVVKVVPDKLRRRPESKAAGKSAAPHNLPEEAASLSSSAGGGRGDARARDGKPHRPAATTWSACAAGNERKALRRKSRAAPPEKSGRNSAT